MIVRFFLYIFTFLIIVFSAKTWTVFLFYDGYIEENVKVLSYSMDTVSSGQGSAIRYQIKGEYESGEEKIMIVRPSKFYAHYPRCGILIPIYKNKKIANFIGWGTIYGENWKSKTNIATSSIVRLVLVLLCFIPALVYSLIDKNKSRTSAWTLRGKSHKFHA